MPTMSSKRKWSDMDDSDDEEPVMGKQVLPIANLPADFDGEPMDGMQYLFTVRRDSRMLPHVTRVVNPYEIEEKPYQSPKDVPQTSSRLPSEEWREVFLLRFSNFRQNCTQPTIHIDLLSRSTHKLIPDRKERDYWWAFLNGRPESEWNPPKKPKGQNKQNQRYEDSTRSGMRGFPAEDDISSSLARAGPSLPYGSMSEEGEVEQTLSVDPRDSLPTPSGTPAPPDPTAEVILAETTTSGTRTSTPMHREPTPTLMRHIDHRYAIHLLMYFAHWINLYLEEEQPRKYTITEAHARWIFVLLSRVDEYLSADETSTLRSLARGCMNLIRERMEFAESSEEANSAEARKEVDSMISEPSCWMIITAVIGIWAQRDLWQDAEDMLSVKNAT